MITATLNLEQALKLVNREDVSRAVRIMGALSAARILLGSEPLQEGDTRRAIIDIIESLGDVNEASTGRGAFIGPITFDATVHFIGEDGRSGKAMVCFPPGKAIGREDVMRTISQAVALVGHLGMKPMGPNTFFNHVLVKEKTGRIELEPGACENRGDRHEEDDADEHH